MKKSTVLLIIVALALVLCATVAFGFPAVEVYQSTSKSVVLIVSKNQGGNMLGAGSVVTSDGHIITNAHVVINKKTHRPYDTVRVFIKPDEVTGDLKRDLVNQYKAKVIEYDEDLDLALLRAYELPLDVRPVPLANPKEIMIGEEVVAIGHPEQGGLWSLTYGRISGQIASQNKVRGKDVYQTDTSVNRGNSGGPLLDRRGYMVGVNTNIARLGEGNLPITGVNFALKSAVVQKWMKQEGYRLSYGTESMYAKPETASEAPAAKAEPAQAEPKAEPAPPKKKVEPAPEPRKAMPEPKMAEPKDEPAMKGPSVKEELKSDTILTPKRPFTQDDLYSEVEKEMEDIMDEMRMKIRR
jgi:serine protease Do